jgi:serine/threonine-protein kinase
MEYIAGGTLAEARNRSLDVDALARELLDGVAHIHAAGILHRDIKPANVLLDDDGSPRLTDFGIARGEETSSLTQTGQVLGTLRYIAPEVAAGEPATVKSDVYALGIVLGDLSGTRSEQLDRLVQRMAAVDPVDRPGSAAEALAELEPTGLLGSAPEPAPAASDRTDVTARLRTRAPARGQIPGLGRRVLVVAAVVVAVVVIAIVALSGGGSNTQRQLGPSAGPQPASPGAPVDQQLDRLERIVRSVPSKN